MNEGMQRIRSLSFTRMPQSKESLIDLFSLLPDEAVLEFWGFDFSRGCFMVGVYHPSFSEIDRSVMVPELQVIEEMQKTFFGRSIRMTVELIDPVTGKNVKTLGEIL